MSSSKPWKTCVLLSTYNGERFLEEQLESLEQQSRQIDYLIARDDGSSDRTIAILRDFATRSQMQVHIVEGTNMGPQRSFRELFGLGLATDADIFFFCDQDDVWVREKVEEFVHRFSEPRSVEFVFSGQLLVDESNRPLAQTPAPRLTGLGNALIENVATGCAMACSRGCLELGNEGNSTTPVMHDWWLYIIASAFGRVNYLDRALTRYRQHGSNVLGKSTTRFSRIQRRLRRIVRAASFQISANAGDVLRIHSDRLRPEQRETVALVASLPHSLQSRIRLICSGRCWRQRPFDQIYWRILCLGGRY